MLIYESMGNMESEDASNLILQHVRFQTIGYFYTIYQFQDPNPRLIISVQKKRKEQEIWAHVYAKQYQQQKIRRSC